MSLLFSHYTLHRFPMLTRFVQAEDDSGDIQLHYGENYRFESTSSLCWLALTISFPLIYVAVRVGNSKAIRRILRVDPSCAMIRNSQVSPNPDAVVDEIQYLSNTLFSVGLLSTPSRSSDRQLFCGSTTLFNGTCFCRGTGQSSYHFVLQHEYFTYRPLHSAKKAVFLFTRRLWQGLTIQTHPRLLLHWLLLSHHQ